VFRDPEFGTVYRSQFLNEASLAGKLRHPHIVNILDAVVGEDSGHIAMELVTGGDLSKHVTSGKLLPVADVIQVGFKCCGALEYAAKEGIVHRDIKPANIMIAGGTEVKIADFGAAVLKKSQVVQTAALGSPYYMSPEQIEDKTLTFHSDMYSFGVVLYELLTGAPPFREPSEDEQDTLLERIQRGRFEALRRAAPGTPRWLVRLVQALLRAKPRRRPATVQLVRRSLERRLRTFPADARSEIANWLWQEAVFQPREGDTIVLSVAEEARGATRPWLRVALALALGGALLSSALVRIEPDAVDAWVARTRTALSAPSAQ
jgi:serine/threonine protein kinase